MKGLGKSFVVGKLMLTLIVIVGGFGLILKFNDTREGIKEYCKFLEVYVTCNDSVHIILHKGEAIMFEELLEKINNLEKNMVLLLDLHMQQTNSLTTYNEVASFLGRTTRTVQNYIKDSKLVVNKHYYIDANGKTVFIPQAIMEFKHSSTESKAKAIVNTDTTAPRVIHPIAEKLLQGVA